MPPRTLPQCLPNQDRGASGVCRFCARAVGRWAIFVCALLWCATVPARAEESDKVLHVLNRLTYGPTPGDLERVTAMGTAAFIASQLEPERLDEPAALTEKLAGLPTESMDTVRLFREFGPKADTDGPPGPEAMRRVFDRAGAVALEAAKARLYRAILSRRQLYELMVAFWSDHFNLGAKKGLATLWVGAFEREAIRPHAMGRFLDLLSATAMHPAMLIAFGNWKNMSPRHGVSAPGEGLETSYAAVVLNNQTLGPGGPQKAGDVKALARIFTGWRVGAARDGAETGGFHFEPDLHDPTDKVFLGQPIKGSGVGEGAAALRILAGHKVTGRDHQPQAHPSISCATNHRRAWSSGWPRLSRPRRATSARCCGRFSPVRNFSIPSTWAIGSNAPCARWCRRCEPWVACPGIPRPWSARWMALASLFMRLVPLTGIRF